MADFADSDIITFDDIFSKKDFYIINEYLKQDKWRFGHGSVPKEHPNFAKSTPFWGMYFDDEKYFTDYLLNIIQEKTNQKFSLYTVYANGHTYGTRGSFHQDWYEDNGRTFLYYANSEWDVEWGGKTIFDLGNGKYYYHLPKPNTAIYFPGIIPHTAESTTRLFTGLRLTVAWKLILK